MQHKTVALNIDGLNITGQLYLPAVKSSYPAVCICHGIPAGIPDPNDEGYAPLAKRLCSHSLTVFTFNFRGAGSSGGNLDILGWTRDLKAVIEYLSALPEVAHFSLSLLGFSAGAAVSIYVAARDSRVSSVAACACPAEFTSLAQIQDTESLLDHFRRIGVIRDKGFPYSILEWSNGFKELSPIKYVAQISPRPLLLVHGSNDEMVSVSHARRLYAKAGKPKELVVIGDAGHRLRDDDRVVDTVLEWLLSHA